MPAIAAVGHNLNRFLNQNYERNYDELDSLMTNSFTYLLSPSLKYFHSIMLKRFSSTIKPPLIYYTGFWSTNLMFYWKCYSVPHVNAGNPQYAEHQNNTNTSSIICCPLVCLKCYITTLKEAGPCTAVELTRVSNASRK